MTKIDSPIKIGSFTLKNRITFAPTVKFDFTDDSGKANDKLIDHYTQRAKGGCGLICVEAVAVVPGGRFCKTHMGLWSDEQIEGHKKIVEGCHKHGAVVIIQLNHTGYTSNPECGPAIGPSSVKWGAPSGEVLTHEMSVEEIHQMQQSYVEAAVRAKKAGYDGVQFHSCHGYLINQFMSPCSNFRTDEYGGSSQNRARFCSEMILKVRELCGKDFLISVRISGFEDNLQKSIEVAEEYVKAGAEYLQVSSGMTSLATLEPFEDSKVSDIQSLGAYFKKHFNGRIPVSCVGGLKDAAQIKYLIENEYVDTVDVARAILADPNFANAVINGTDFAKCIGCKQCQFGPFTAHKCPAGSELEKNSEFRIRNSVT
ncbi:MAG: NADH:flavin oxidoreductase [Treponema sp.]|nr:NADH:flavin oxidoreductase [Treponema sp.]